MRILLILVFLGLSGCSLFKGDVEYREVPIYTKVVCPKLTAVPPLEMLDVVFVKAQDEKGNEVLGLSGRNYVALGINTNRITTYIEEQNKAIDYYIGCIDTHNSEVEKENGEQ